MSRELLYYPDQSLKTPAQPVENPGAWDELVEDMKRLIRIHEGIGLAAPQVGESVRIFLLRLDPEEQLYEVYFNPEIKNIRHRETVSEGCLSFPEITVEIERGLEVDFSALTPGGRAIERTVDGLQAQCVQHEVDHLEGRTLVDRCDLTQKMEVDAQMKAFHSEKQTSTEPNS